MFYSSSGLRYGLNKEGPKALPLPSTVDPNGENKDARSRSAGECAAASGFLYGEALCVAGIAGPLPAEVTAGA